MAYKNYNTLLLFRLLVLILNTLAIGVLVGLQHSVLLITLLSLFEIGFIFWLVLFLNSTNQQISYFIQAIKNDDTTLRFPVKTGNKVVNELHKSLNELNVVLQQTKLKSQLRERYFSEIIQNIGTGVMVYNEKGFVTEVNPAAMELIGLQTITHLAQIDRIDPKFKAELLKLSNRQKQVFTLRKPNEQVQIIVRCTLINLKDEYVKLVTLQDIRGELEKKEIDSWVKLIRVLSHEIMNSLAPVTSIAHSLKSIWKTNVAATENRYSIESDIQNTINGLEVISERGEALVRFVQSYRMLTKLPVPHMESLSITSFFERLSILVSPLKEEFGIAITFHYPSNDFMVTMDEQMMVQVVINLVKNSAEAMTGVQHPVVEIEVLQLPNHQIQIQVADNGQGISLEVIDQIFVPFFTTKEQGTGIGLSYSRQVLRAHGGSISCKSKPGETVFTLQW